MGFIGTVHNAIKMTTVYAQVYELLRPDVIVHDPAAEPVNCGSVKSNELSSLFLKRELLSISSRITTAFLVGVDESVKKSSTGKYSWSLSVGVPARRESSP